MGSLIAEAHGLESLLHCHPFCFGTLRPVDFEMLSLEQAPGCEAYKQENE
ncbi:MAG: hypothetical protein AMXMBFR19_00440 [Chthonomonadaceae bacterium]|nr:MAG: hypothetical protein UZ18_ATM001000794 [Armatimonadetes bacterium OLB18]